MARSPHGIYIFHRNLFVHANEAWLRLYGIGSIEEVVGRPPWEFVAPVDKKRARSYAEDRGILLADTKFEFGVREGRLIWIDEALTPDSSRFWPRDGYAPGSAQPSFDKQYLRDYLESLGWDKRPPGPELPPEVVRRTTEKYLEAYSRLTGRPLGEKW